MKLIDTCLRILDTVKENKSTCIQVNNIVWRDRGPRLDTANRSILELGHLSASNETSVWRKSWTTASTPAFATPGLRSLVITYPMNTNCYIVACPPFVIAVDTSGARGTLASHMRWVRWRRWAAFGGGRPARRVHSSSMFTRPQTEDSNVRRRNIHLCKLRLAAY